MHNSMVSIRHCAIKSRQFKHHMAYDAHFFNLVGGTVEVILDMGHMADDHMAYNHMAYDII